MSVQDQLRGMGRWAACCGRNGNTSCLANRDAVTVGLQSHLDRLHGDDLLFGLALWELQERGNGNVGRDNRLGTLGTCTQGRLVVLVKAVGIFECQLRLADPSLWL
jgi:hypothetical protein